MTTPETPSPSPEASWIIWSNEHRAFWNPDRRGYTRHIEQAGRYTKAEADAICSGANYRSGSDLSRSIAPEICMPAPEALDAFRPASSPPARRWNSETKTFDWPQFFRDAFPPVPPASGTEEAPGVTGDSAPSVSGDEDLEEYFNRPRGPAPVGAETGWLIEHEDEPKWLTLRPGEAAYEVCWTKESNDALRFARRADADDYASTFLDEGPIRVTEHLWL